MNSLKVIALVWTTASAIGATFSAIMLKEAVLDRRAVLAQLHPDPALLLLATGHVRSEASRLATQVAFLIVGALAFVYAAPPEQIRAVNRLLLLAGASLVYLNSVMNSRLRRQLLDLIREREEPDPG